MRHIQRLIVRNVLDVLLLVVVCASPLLNSGDCLKALAAGGAPDTKRLFQLQLAKPDEKINIGVAYWIELVRDGKTYRCNNKFTFKSGDHIRIHVIPNVDCYAYIVQKSGSRGDKALLFPRDGSNGDNFLRHGSDYALPSTGSLIFDNDQGTELISLVLSRQALDIKSYMNRSTEEQVFVASREAGAKDLVPTRMQLCWDDPAPVIMPEDVPMRQVVASADISAPSGPSAPQANLSDPGLVTVVFNKPDAILSVDVALEHQ